MVSRSRKTSCSALGLAPRVELMISHQAQEAMLLIRIVAEQPGEARRDRSRAILANAAYRHAGVLGLNQHGHTARLEHGVDRTRDLRREMLLRLQPVGENIDQARELR